MTKRSQALMVLFQALLSVTCLGNTQAQTHADKGRIVIFSDLKSGDFKSDIAIKEGTNQTLNPLMQSFLHPNVHTCFRGPVTSIKPLVDSLVANTNKANGNQDLRLESFSATGDGHQTIRATITSESARSSVVNFTLDPC